jgi:hypothetical protein
VAALSLGGDAGDGGKADAATANGGNGGAGGPGGPAAFKLDSGGSIAANYASSAVPSDSSTQPAILVQSNGGAGGEGGSASAARGEGGGGGFGGAGGSASAEIDGSVAASGEFSHGALVQSVGGVGGNGNRAFGFFFAKGGAGLTGGDGGPVSISGAGGSATAAGTAPLSLAIGGDGKGDTVTVDNGGLITTFGDHAGGIAAQSVGGGGGKGGAGVAFSANLIATAVAIGGQGGGGGNGGDVNLTNQDQVTTHGPDAYGLSAQSVSGGGHGGTAAATAVALSPDPEVPAISVGGGVGGSGGAGGTGGTVELTNDGFIATAGHGSIGLLGQSLGGGGGSGGDSSATAFAAGGGVNIAVNVAIGGSGGTGGPVTVGNQGLLLTLGESAHGIFGQSVGGGGGLGSGGDASATSSESEEFGLSASITVGGNGGSASQGGQVKITNAGGIATRGDGAKGIFGQSVGGGGGAPRAGASARPTAKTSASA